MENTILISLNTLKEVVRQKLLLIVSLIALGLVLSSKYLLKLDLGHEQLRFIFDFGCGALSFFGAIIAVVASCQLVHAELENKTVITLLSKPVGFKQFCIGKFLGSSIALGLFAFIIAVATCIMLFITNLSFGDRSAIMSAGLEINYMGVLAFTFLQWLKLCVISAIAILVCSVSTSLLFSVIVSFMILTVSMMGDITLSAGGDSAFTKIMMYVFPDFNVFSVAEVYAFAPVDSTGFLSAISYGLVYITVSLLCASLLFSKREF